jgi:hypothetical protein
MKLTIIGGKNIQKSETEVKKKELTQVVGKKNHLSNFSNSHSITHLSEETFNVG